MISSSWARAPNSKHRFTFISQHLWFDDFSSFFVISKIVAWLIKWIMIWTIKNSSKQYSRITNLEFIKLETGKQFLALTRRFAVRTAKKFQPRNCTEQRCGFLVVSYSKLTLCKVQINWEILLHFWSLRRIPMSYTMNLMIRERRIDTYSKIVLPLRNGLFILSPSDMWRWVSSGNTNKGSNSTRFYPLALWGLFDHRRICKENTKHRARGFKCTKLNHIQSPHWTQA